MGKEERSHSSPAQHPSGEPRKTPKSQPAPISQFWAKEVNTEVRVTGWDQQKDRRKTSDWLPGSCKSWEQDEVPLETGKEVKR